MKAMKRFNNKILIITFIVLAAAFVLTKMFRSPGLESNLDDDLFKADTAEITELKIYPEAEKRQEIKLVKDGKTWKVVKNDRTAPAETFRVNTLLNSIASLKPERMVSRKKEKWDDYEVGDTTAVQIIAIKENNEILNLRVGKQSGASAYVRIDDEDEVYAVAGLSRSEVDKSFNDWRDKSFLHVDRDKITKITFNYPADSSFVAEKKDNVWMIGNEKADSAKMERYLNKIRSKDISSFADDFKAGANPDVALTIESGTVPLATVKGWRESFYKWILSSSRQEDTYFADEGPVVAKELFVGKKELTQSTSQAVK
jgi:hypothetical protein